MTHPAFRDKGSKLYLPCGTRDRVCKSGTVPDVSGRLAAMISLEIFFIFLFKCPFLSFKDLVQFEFGKVMYFLFRLLVWFAVVDNFFM